MKSGAECKAVASDCDSGEPEAQKRNSPPEGRAARPAEPGKSMSWRTDLPRKPALSSSRKSSFLAAAELCRHASRPCNGPLARRGTHVLLQPDGGRHRRRSHTDPPGPSLESDLAGSRSRCGGR